MNHLGLFRTRTFSFTKHIGIKFSIEKGR